MYLGQIGRSLEAADIERLLAVPGAAAELRSCRKPVDNHLTWISRALAARSAA